MKRFLTIVLCMAAMVVASLSAKAQEVMITLFPGWNWISYPNAEVMDINTALGDFVPMNGDIIHSQYGSSAYVNGYWRGGVTHFMPGWGYMYYSNRTEVVSFVFGETAPQLTVTTAEPNDITATSAISGGSITSNDGSYIYVFMKGICWATHPNPMVMNDFFTENGSGADSFTAEMTDLTPNTEYYVRAFAVTLDGTFYGEEVSFTTLSIPEGAINGLFTVSGSKRVYFSQGNLQYQASTGTWRFATNQWDYVGETNTNISESYNGWIDLFGWGTSGFNHGAICYQPFSTSQSSSDYYAYGQWEYHLYDQTGRAEWGYNLISNGGNQLNQWRTLTYDEWCYVLFNRGTPTGIRFARARVNDINGIILLPDDWSISYYSLSSTNSTNSNFSNNTISVFQWTTLEQHGAIFLPVAGRRYGSTYSSGGGFYWSASRSNEVGACSLGFYDSYTSTNDYYYRYDGRSVRLVQDCNQ